MAENNCTARLNRLRKNLSVRFSISAVQQEEGRYCLTDIINCLDSNLQETVKELGRQLITESSSIRFGYFHDKTGENFKFKYDVPFISKKHDIAILELIEDPSKVFPDSVELVSLNAPKTLIHILGHPGGRELQTDPGCKIIYDEHELEKTIKESVKFFSTLFVNIPIDESDFSKCKISAEQILFHCSKSTAHGASGSPLIQNENDQPEVIGMLLEGYPKIFYNELCNNIEANKRPDLLIESGISMEKVKSLLFEHRLSELSKSIFTR
ncbi:uncharacterized protein LOC134240824 [Saccostrea cucullata]|uniref:uncharacterized protein LOC134240824 n=1 Tax=Saccostrea cuccullata TaxID=36930 RepID=UPI002ED0B394